jgi:ribonuclease Z
LEIKFIGTGSGKASLNRYHSSFMILSEKFNLLIDAGDGISKALLAGEISFDQIDGILFSHLHPDHYSGIAALIVQMKLINRTKILRIYIHRELSGILKNYIYTSYLFKERMDFEIKYEEFDHNKEINVCDEINFMSRQNSHLDQYIEFDKENRLNFICSSFLFKLNQINIFYTGDVGSGKDLHLFEDEKIQMMICETTHLDISDLLNVIQTYDSDKIFLTHFDNETETKLLNWINSLPEIIRNRFLIAYDNLSVPI